MGRQGSKPRKPRRSQHLPKVGTATENERALHGEREAVLDNMGLGSTGRGAKVILATIAVLIVVVAILAFVALD
jgi:hypothetical protein